MEKKEYSVNEIRQNIKLIIELEIETEDIASQDDQYKLFCSDDESVYKQTLTVKDDQVQGDEFLTLKFLRLIPGHSYTLEIDPGVAGEPYYTFEDVPLKELLSEQITYESDESEVEDEEIPDDVEVLEEGSDDVVEWLVESKEPMEDSYMRDEDLEEEISDEDESLT